MTAFPLGPGELTISDARISYANLRAKFAERADDRMRAFKATFGGISADAAPLETIEGARNDAVNEAAEMALTSLAGFKVYDVSEEAVRERILRYAADHGAFEGTQSITASVHEIITEANERAAQYAAEVEGRPQIIGGGFGVQGAVGGMVIAGASNAVIGAIYGLSAKMKNGLASAADRRKLQQLFANPATRDAIASDIYAIVLAGAPVVATVVNERAGEETLSLISEADAVRAKSMRENVLGGRVPADEVQGVLIEGLNLNPFSEKLWIQWLDRFGDADESTSTAAEALCLPIVKSHKKHQMDTKRSSLRWATPEQCKESADILEPFANWLGVSFAIEKAEIEDRIAKLDRDRRTFDGVLYESVAEANAARKQKAERIADVARRTFEGQVFDTEDDMLRARADAEERAKRTFKGAVYESTEAAERARKAYLESTDPFLWLCIILSPIPNALWTLQEGFDKRQRLIAAGSTLLWGLLIAASEAPLAFLTGMAIAGAILAVVRLAIVAIAKATSDLIRGRAPMNDLQLGTIRSNQPRTSHEETAQRSRTLYDRLVWDRTVKDPR